MPGERLQRPWQWHEAGHHAQASPANVHVARLHPRRCSAWRTCACSTPVRTSRRRRSPCGGRRAVGHAAGCTLSMACGTSASQANWQALLWPRDVRHALRTCRVPPWANAVHPGRCGGPLRRARARAQRHALHSRVPPQRSAWSMHCDGIMHVPWQPWQKADGCWQGPCDARSLWHSLRCDGVTGSLGCDAVSPGAGAACSCGHAAEQSQAGDAGRNLQPLDGRAAAQHRRHVRQARAARLQLRARVVRLLREFGHLRPCALRCAAASAACAHTEAAPGASSHAGAMHQCSASRNSLSMQRNKLSRALSVPCHTYTNTQAMQRKRFHPTLRRCALQERTGMAMMPRLAGCTSTSRLLHPPAACPLPHTSLLGSTSASLAASSAAAHSAARRCSSSRCSAARRACAARARSAGAASCALSAASRASTAASEPAA